MSKPGPYTPSRLVGSLAQLNGVTFSSYYAYQQQRAFVMTGRASYAAQRRVTGISLVQTLTNRLVARGGLSRTDAQQAASAWYQGQQYRGRSYPAGTPPAARGGERSAAGRRKHDAIRLLLDYGAYDTGDEAAEDIPY